MSKSNGNEDLAIIAGMLKAADPLYTTVDKQKVEQVKETARITEEAIKGEDIEVTTKLFKPYKDSGAVIVMGEKMIILDTRLFAKAVSSCKIFNIYPRTDGVTRMDFTFNGLMKMDGDEDNTEENQNSGSVSIVEDVRETLENISEGLNMTIQSKSSGGVRVTAQDIIVRDVDTLAEVIALCKSIEITTIAEDKTQIDFNC